MWQLCADLGECGRSWPARATHFCRRCLSPIQVPADISCGHSPMHMHTYIHTYIHTCPVNQHTNKYDSGTRKEVDDTSAKPIIAARERAHDGISIFFTKSFCGSCKQVFCKHLKNNVSMYVCMCGSLTCDGHSHLRILLRDEELVLVDRFFVLRLHLQKSVLKSCQGNAFIYIHLSMDQLPNFL